LEVGQRRRAHPRDHDADPSRLTPQVARSWANEAGFRTLAGYVGGVAARSPDGLGLAREWSKSTDDLIRGAGYSAMMELLKNGGGLTDKECEESIRGEIEKGIHSASNWSRYGMMYALIGFGSYKPALTEKAVAAARRIGKVEFDPEGRTARCRTRALHPQEPWPIKQRWRSGKK